MGVTAIWIAAMPFGKRESPSFPAEAEGGIGAGRIQMAANSRTKGDGDLLRPNSFLEDVHRRRVWLPY